MKKERKKRVLRTKLSFELKKALTKAIGEYNGAGADLAEQLKVNYNRLYEAKKLGLATPELIEKLRRRLSVAA